MAACRRGSWYQWWHLLPGWMDPEDNAWTESQSSGLIEVVRTTSGFLGEQNLLLHSGVKEVTCTVWNRSSAGLQVVMWVGATMCWVSPCMISLYKLWFDFQNSWLLCCHIILQIYLISLLLLFNFQDSFWHCRSIFWMGAEWHFWWAINLLKFSVWDT